MPLQLTRHLSLRPLARVARMGWLALLVVLALHPAALAGEMGSSGLAVLLRELLCGCESCAGELEESDAPQGCCEREQAPARESDCGTGGGCSCTHPDEVPLGESTPLAQPDGSRRDLLGACEVGGDDHRPACTAGEVPRSSAPSARDSRPPPGGSSRAAHARRVQATGERLAWLATFLI